MLCYVVLCGVVLCYVALYPMMICVVSDDVCYVVLCGVVLCYVALYPMMCVVSCGVAHFNDLIILLYHIAQIGRAHV